MIIEGRALITTHIKRQAQMCLCANISNFSSKFERDFNQNIFSGLGFDYCLGNDFVSVNNDTVGMYKF